MSTAVITTRIEDEMVSNDDMPCNQRVVEPVGDGICVLCGHPRKSHERMTQEEWEQER